MFKSLLKKIGDRISAKLFARRRKKQERQRIVNRLKAAVDKKKELYELYYDQRNTILIRVAAREGVNSLKQQDFKYIEKKFKKLMRVRWMDFSYNKEEKFYNVKVSFIF